MQSHHYAVCFILELLGHPLRTRFNWYLGSWLFLSNMAVTFTHDRNKNSSLFHSYVCFNYNKIKSCYMCMYFWFNHVITMLFIFYNTWQRIKATEHSSQCPWDMNGRDHSLLAMVKNSTERDTANILSTKLSWVSLQSHTLLFHILRHQSPLYRPRLE